MDNKYFGLKDYLRSERFMGKKSFQKYTFPNGFSALVRSYKASINYPNDYYTIDILVSDNFAYNTGISDETIRVFNPKEVQETLLKIKQLSLL